MAKTAKLADGTTLSFPDETPDAVMDKVVQQHVAAGATKTRQEAGRMASEGMGFGEKMLVGAGAGMQNVLESVGAGRLGRYLGGDVSTAEGKDYRKGLGVAGTIGELGAEVATTMLPAAKAAQLASRGLRMAGRTLTPLGTAGIEGATAGALTSPEDQGTGAVAGGFGGMVGQKVLGKLAERFAKPVPQSEGAELLRRQGVRVSAGQGADVSSLAGRTGQAVEESLASLPLLGLPLARKRAAGAEDFRKRVLEKALPPGGSIPAGTTDEAVKGIRAQFSDMYETALKGKKISVDEPYEAFVTKAINDPARYMTQHQRDYVESLVGKHIFEQQRNPVTAARQAAAAAEVGRPNLLPQARAAAALPGGGPGTAVGRPRAELGPVQQPGRIPLKDVDDVTAPLGREAPFIDANTLFKGQSELRTLARKFANTGKPSEAELAKVLREIADETNQLIGRQHEGAGTMIQKLRYPFARFSAVEKAAEKAGGAGNFTPTQLRKAAKGASDELRDFAKQAEQFVQKGEGSGKISWPAVGALAGGYFMGGPAGIGATTAAISALGTKTGQRVMRGDTAAQRLLAARLRSELPVSSIIGGDVGANIAEGRR